MESFSGTFISDLVCAVFDGIIVHNGTQITNANDRAARMFGYEQADALVGLPYQSLLAAEGRRPTEQRVESGVEGPYRALCRRQDGGVFAVDVNVKESRFNGNRARIVALRYTLDHDETVVRRSLALGQTVKALASTIEQRDTFTAGHQTRVSEIATRIAVELGLSDREIATIRIAGNIHDIGKISVPAEILMKPVSLTEQEYNLVKIHPEIGFAIINGVDFDGPVQQTVLQHHERLDGTGYPNRVADPIPEARIIAVADVYDALTSSRPYRMGMPPGDALQHLQREEGHRLDADALEKLHAVVLH